MGYFARQLGFGFLYIFCMDMIALGIESIGTDFVKLVLCVVNIGLFFFLMTVIFYKEGQQARKTLHTNNVERRYIIETGEDRKIRRAEEYTPWKGYLMGLLLCAPLLIMILLHLIIGIFGGGNGLGVAAVSAYICFYLPYGILFTGGTAIVSWAQYFVILYCVPMIVLFIGIPYKMGAKKISNEYHAIKEHSGIIYGKK